MPLLLAIVVSSCVASIAAATAAHAWITRPIPLVGSWIRLVLTMNPGIAFGVHLPSPWQELLIAVALVIICVAAVRANERIAHVAYGLIMGGALGNIIDRIPDGFVTDYFSIGSFPVFNIADSCITIGILLLLVQSIRVGRNIQRNA